MISFIKNTFTFCAICLVATSCSTLNSKQRSIKEQAKLDSVRKMIDNQNYVFIPLRANPLGYSTINLNYYFSIDISKDSINSYLPYYGRAYVAPMNPSDPQETGVVFNSKNFSYQKKQKNDGWEILIKPNDEKSIQGMIFRISPSGYGNLSVNSLNRQVISYDGYLEAPKKKPKP